MSTSIKVAPLRSDHAESLVLMEAELQRTRGDLYAVRDLENGLEANALLADIALARLLDFLCAMSDSTY